MVSSMTRKELILDLFVGYRSRLSSRIVRRSNNSFQVFEKHFDILRLLKLAQRSVNHTRDFA
jgi:hypothetical protein